MSGSAYDPNDQEPLEGLFGDVFDLADEIASRIGPEEIEGRLRRTLREAAAGSNPRVLRPDQAADSESTDLAVPDQSKNVDSPQAAGLPLYRTIIALDIETSTTRPNPVKGELRNKAYELFEAALTGAGISSRHRDRFTDRGDGILALIHPVDQAPKALLLTRVVPLLSQLLTEYNASLSRWSLPQRQLRIRVVVHAGEIHYDANGCYGEALDIAFRLLDAAPVKKVFRGTADPLVLVISGYIHDSVVRPGHGGIDYQSFRPGVRVQIGGRRYPGWIKPPRPALPLTATQLARNQRLA